MAQQLKWLINDKNSKGYVVQAHSSVQALEAAKLLPMGSSHTYTARLLTDAELVAYNSARTIPAF